jgi:hypothetical protein
MDMPRSDVTALSPSERVVTAFKRPWPFAPPGLRRILNGTKGVTATTRRKSHVIQPRDTSHRSHALNADEPKELVQPKALECLRCLAGPRPQIRSFGRRCLLRAARSRSAACTHHRLTVHERERWCRPDPGRAPPAYASPSRSEGSNSCGRAAFADTLAPRGRMPRTRLAMTCATPSYRPACLPG